MVAEPRSPVAQLYFDEDVDARLAEALRQRGDDVETPLSAGLLAASDDEQLAYAANLGHPQYQALSQAPCRMDRGWSKTLGYRHSHWAFRNWVVVAPYGNSVESFLSPRVTESLAVPRR